MRDRGSTTKQIDWKPESSSAVAHSSILFGTEKDSSYSMHRKMRSIAMLSGEEGRDHAKEKL